MSNGVTLNSGSRSALTSLQGIQSQMNVLQQRLSTGRKVNSPTDNPTAYFLASSLTSRATSLGRLADNIETAKSAVTAANNGISAIRSLLSSAQSIANTALQSSQSLVTVTGNNSSALTTGTTIASNGGSSTRFKTGDVLTISDGTTTATYTAANNDTVQTLLNTINGTSGLKLAASLNSSGQITLTTTSNVNVTISATVNGAGGATLNSVTGLTAGTTSYTTNTIRSNMATQFASLRTQIDAAAQDASYNGVNFLTGSSLSVSFNETGSSSATFTGISLTSNGLNLGAAANTWQLDSDINTSLTAISNAINALTSYSASFSAMSTVMDTRADFNQAMIDTLNTGADALTANDADEDGALLLALQTRQQIATTALSLMQNSQASVLKLFGY